MFGENIGRYKTRDIREDSRKNKSHGQFRKGGGGGLNTSRAFEGVLEQQYCLTKMADSPKSKFNQKLSLNIKIDEYHPEKICQAEICHLHH